MKKIIAAASICVVMMSATFAVAQSSQGKGGAAMTGETADPTKGIGAPGSSSVGTAPTNDTVAPTTGTTNPTNPATGAPVPNAAISRPPGDAAAPAGR